jgi:RNA-directed DNA polymerase
VIFVRFADDYVAGFEHRDDAERFLADLRERLARFALELNAEKTRLIEFGRFAAERRAGRGLRKPETFEFLGFTHICAKDRHGRFKLKRITSNKRMQAKLSSVKTELMRRRHLPIPDNNEALRGFHLRVVWHWHRALRRRSQRTRRLNWKRMDRLAERWLPPPRILHPWPTVRFDATTRGRSPVR